MILYTSYTVVEGTPFGDEGFHPLCNGEVPGPAVVEDYQLAHQAEVAPYFSLKSWLKSKPSFARARDSSCGKPT